MIQIPVLSAEDVQLIAKDSYSRWLPNRVDDDGITVAHHCDHVSSLVGSLAVADDIRPQMVPFPRTMKNYVWGCPNSVVIFHRLKSLLPASCAHLVICTIAFSKQAVYAEDGVRYVYVLVLYQ